ncbi:hypothetical protein Fmac_031775 [Flemingia macrophylla]|uniref:Uncharacterized protein n=1 Tax=Flemingia macrophylla TaxID=520843 RepID=A0ABD1L307_9FABA
MNGNHPQRQKLGFLFLPDLNDSPKMNPIPPYHPMLKESITRFLDRHRAGATDFADFTSIFSRTIHSTPDPPIPLLWFYAALQFRSQPPLPAARDLFHLLASCSAARPSASRIAALAPLLSVLHRLALADPASRVQAAALAEGVVSYCSIFCAREGSSGDDSADVAVLDFADLVRVWTVDDGGAEEGFFPLVSEGVRKGVQKGCEVGVLAGVVMCEALLLKLCLAFLSGVGRAEQEKKLMASAVHTITGFRSFRFLVRGLSVGSEPNYVSLLMLYWHVLILRYPFQDDVGASFTSDLSTDQLQITTSPLSPHGMCLMEPSHVLTSLPSIEVTQGSENEVLLKEVLYNSVMTIEYSFINPQAEFSLYANSLKDVAITWLFVAELALQSAREKGDQGKAMSYINAFCRSCIPIQLITWVTSQNSVGRKISRPNVSTPIALIKWLLVVQEQGFAVFASETAKQINFMLKANFFTSRTECLLPVIKHFFNNLDKNHFTNSINGEGKVDGDVEMLDTVDTVNLAAAESLSTVIHGTRKRKEGIEDDTKTQLKFMRCQLLENSVRENTFVFRQQ